MIKLDGSFGEGGGAILRQALALSTYTGKPFEIENIRKNRPQSGLKPQHMHSIIALEKVSGSNVTDCEIGSEKITFIPGTIKNKTVDVDVGTAGSITLLMQSLLMPVIFSGKQVTLNLTGGTDVRWSQPIDYFANVLVPALKEYADIEVRTMQRGYFPKGNGKVTIKIKSKVGDKENLLPINITERDKILQVRGVSHASGDLIDSEVSDKQASRARDLLVDLRVPINIIRQYSRSESTGSGITLWTIFSQKDLHSEKPIIIGADALGEKTKRSEDVGKEAVLNLKKEINSGACVDKYLADQLIPFLAIVGGEIKTSEITKHTKANIYVAEKFLDVKFKIEGTTISV